MSKIFRQQLEEHIVASIERFQKEWKAHALPAATALGVTPAQGALLRVVHTHQPLGSRKLGTLIGVTPGAVTQMVDGLVELGYMLRTPNLSDGRAMDLSITPAGCDILGRLQDIKRRLLVDMFSALDDEELSLLLAMHEKMQQLESYTP